MIEVPERVRLVPFLASRLPEPDERDRLVARARLTRVARSVLGSGLDLAGKQLPKSAFRVLHCVDYLDAPALVLSPEADGGVGATPRALHAAAATPT